MSQGCDDPVPVDAGFDPDTETYLARFDPDAPGSLGGAVIYLVSLATGKDPAAMDLIFEVIDPDALDAIFRPDGSADVQVAFEFCGCDVIAGGDGTVCVTLR